ncbi:MAG: response regulator [bacterium]
MKKLNCILLVDDDSSDNFLNRRAIEKAGITDHIEISLNGREALEFLTAKNDRWNSRHSYPQPELIFLDINMPVMNGWEFLKEHQKLEDFQKGKVVLMMLSASINPADRITAELKLGSDCFQSKPLTVGVINKIMMKYFPDHL